MTILKTVSLGNHYFPIAILLRNLLFVNAVLINSEVWYPFNKSDIEELEIMDRRLMRKILETPDGTPNELLYLELGCIPLEEIIKCRRINFLHYLLTRNEDELVFKFFKAQLRNPSKGDWTNIVKQDIEDFGITETFDEISKLSKSAFKKKVAIACRQFTLNKLLNLKEGHSKGANLVYNKLKLRQYLSSNKLSVSDSKLLFKIRSQMLNVKENFRQKYLNETESLYCQHCKNIETSTKQIQSQEHILVCDSLEEKVQVEYKDLFSLNMDKVKTALEGYKVAWNQFS